MPVFFITIMIIVLGVNPLFAGNNRVSADNRGRGSVGLEFNFPFGRSYSYDDILVSRVIDGDTVQLENGERVRLLGIDTPEIYQSRESEEKARSRGTDVEAIRVLGKQAAVFTKQLLEGKRVRLTFDVDKKDKYDRLLAYVFIDQPPAVDAVMADGYYFIYDGTKTALFCNATIIKSGYGHPMAIPPNLMYADILRALHREAREHKRGLWK
ncbi:MAG: thermonuclease family protein [Candidatus Omnitrophica bacterium]|nr:thermonuclease family protein [Candidatus Omnitrophota bacterium]